MNLNIDTVHRLLTLFPPIAHRLEALSYTGHDAITEQFWIDSIRFLHRLKWVDSRFDVSSHKIYVISKNINHWHCTQLVSANVTSNSHRSNFGSLCSPLSTVAQIGNSMGSWNIEIQWKFIEIHRSPQVRMTVDWDRSDRQFLESDAPIYYRSSCPMDHTMREPKPILNEQNDTALFEQRRCIRRVSSVLSVFTMNYDLISYQNSPWSIFVLIFSIPCFSGRMHSFESLYFLLLRFVLHEVRMTTKVIRLIRQWCSSSPSDREEHRIQMKFFW